MKVLAHGGVVEHDPVLVGADHIDFVPERVAAELNLLYWRPNPAIKTVIVKAKDNAKQSL